METSVNRSGEGDHGSSSNISKALGDLGELSVYQLAAIARMSDPSVFKHDPHVAMAIPYRRRRRYLPGFGRRDRLDSLEKQVAYYRTMDAQLMRMDSTVNDRLRKARDKISRITLEKAVARSKENTPA